MLQEPEAHKLHGYIVHVYFSYKENYHDLPIFYKWHLINIYTDSLLTLTSRANCFFRAGFLKPALILAPRVFYS